jgi:predicted transcriptional regulator
MTKLEIQALLERVLSWPRAMQEEAAEALLGIEAMGAASYVLSEEERRGVERGLDDGDRGSFVPEEEVRAWLDKYLWPSPEEERAELEEAEREIERGEVASDEEVAELFRLGRR